MSSIRRHIKRLRITFTSTLCLLFAFGCDRYLDEIPDNRVELNTLDKASQLLTNGYSIASPSFTHWMSDDVQFTIGNTILPYMEQLYHWEEVTTGGPDNQDSPDFFWFETYNTIAHANEVLAILDDLPIVSAEDQQKRDALEGEAKLIRAYGHFMLVNIFANNYDRTTAGDDPGIPYIKEPEAEFLVQYERESVRKVYQEIEDDLEDGLELVSDNFLSNSGKYHFNRNAALAFASRFYLYKFDIIRSLQYADQLLGSDPSNFIRDFASDEFQSARSSIDAYPQVYTSTDLPANFLVMRKITLVQLPSYSYSPSSDFYSGLFASNPFPGSTDERENPALQAGRNRDGERGSFPLRYPILFQRSSLNSNVGTPYTIQVMLSGEEVLLNRIECNIYQNNIDEAISDLNALFAKRYTGVNNVATMESLRAFLGAENDPDFSDFLVLFNVLIFEKRKEFIAQSMRWFDAKRWGLTIRHDLENGQLDSLDSNDPRWLLQIPSSAVQVGGLEKNER
jgi:hypothetical protein